MKHSNNSCFQDLDMPILCLSNQRGMVSSNRNISNHGTGDTSKARIIYNIGILVLNYFSIHEFENNCYNAISIKFIFYSI